MTTEADVAAEGEAALLLGASASRARALAPSAKTVLRRLLFAVLLFITAIAMTVPVRPLLILDASGGDASLASYFTGVVDSLQAVLTIFSSPLFGAVSDVIGRKPILVLSHLGELLGLFAVASFPRSLAVQFPAYIIIALTNAYVTTANTIIADISAYPTPDNAAPDAATPVSSATNYGVLGAVFGFCFLVGPTLGGTIEDKFYLASSLHVACVIIVVAMVYVSIFLPETKPAASLDTPDSSEDSVQSASPWYRSATPNIFATTRQVADAIRTTDLNPLPRVRRIFAGNLALSWIAVTIATASLAQSGLNSIMFLYVNVRLGWGTKETGIFLSMVGLSLLISQGVLAPLSVRFLGEVPTILIGYALAAVHYYVYAMARTSTTMYIGLLVGMFSFVSEPAMKGLLARQVSIDTQGSLQGSLSALTSVVRPFAPIMSSALFGYGNAIGRPGLPFVAIACVSALSVVFARIAFWQEGLK